MRKSILIVDDEVAMCEVMKDLLKLRGYEVEYTTDGSHAIALARKRNFDVALIDLLMEGMNGVETLKAIKAIQPAIHIFIITAYNEGELIDQALANGALKIFNKPFEIDEMCDVLTESAGNTN